MKLNPDCVRAILLTIEGYTSYRSVVSFDENNILEYPLLVDYPLDDILYHLQKCDEAGFLVGAKLYPLSADVEGLHYKGHEFLENVREPKVWEKTKSAGKEIGINSIQNLGLIAANVASSLIRGYFGLP